MPLALFIQNVTRPQALQLETLTLVYSVSIGINTLNCLVFVVQLNIINRRILTQAFLFSLKACRMQVAFIILIYSIS